MSYIVWEMEPSSESFWELFLDRLIQQQEEKLLQMGRSIIPHLTAEDLLSAHDFPALMAYPPFPYEEGIWVGLQMGKVAISQERARREEGLPATEFDF